MDFINVEFLIDTFFVALGGVPTTLLVALVTLLVSIPIAFFLALGRIYEVRIVNPLTKLYISFVRGTPIILQIFLIYSIMPIILTQYFEQYNIAIEVYDIHPIWYGFVIFIFNTTAGLVEIFRSALLTINKGQLEAAQSVGLSNTQAYIRIIIPQALVSALPNLCTATVNLIKATSLGFAFSLQEITLRAKVAANVGYNYVEA